MTGTSVNAIRDGLHGRKGPHSRTRLPGQIVLIKAESRIIIRLAPVHSTLEYVDIDTSHFSGNEAPMSQVFALCLDEAAHADGQLRIGPKDARWQEILPVVELGPNSRHIFKLGRQAEGYWSAVMVRMIPDGGMVCTRRSTLRHMIVLRM